MPTTVNFMAPNPASTIQSTTWNPVPAKYSPVNIDVALLYPKAMKDSFGIVVPYMPGRDEAIKQWGFWKRSDYATADIRYAELLGIRVVTKNEQATPLNPSENVGVRVLTKYEVTSIVWRFGKMTLANGGIYHVHDEPSARISAYVDPDTGSILYGDYLGYGIDEAVGFLVKRVAASLPTYTPFLDALGRDLPVRGN